jgi:hypothetical protein
VINENFFNSGTFQVGASASAHGSTAVVDATAYGVYQFASDASAIAQYATNSGGITVSANAFAQGVFSADAHAFAGGGLSQVASDALYATQVAHNTGTIALSANATASAPLAGHANATATASSGMYQNATEVVSAAQSMVNNGVVSLVANASATGGGDASAYAFASTAMRQVGLVFTDVQFMSNAGTVTATANAHAVANGGIDASSGEAVLVGTAFASADARGMQQSVTALNYATQSMINSGTLNVGAHAAASAPATTSAGGAFPVGAATAQAYATGASQSLVGSGAQFFSNAGTINVNAAATQVGTTGHAFAQALGYHGFHKSGSQYITALFSC